MEIGTVNQSSQNKSIRSGTDISINESALGTRTPDEVYNVVSILYHSLKLASKCDTFAADAGNTGNSEISEFIQFVKQQELTKAERAKKILSTCLSSDTNGQSDRLM